jgi:hypothetical protein
MGYSDNKAVVDKPEVRLIIETILKSDADFKVPSNRPNDLAYAIREAFHVIELYPKSFANLVPAVDKFKIKTRGDHLLFVRKLGLITGSPMPVTTEGLAAARSLVLDEVTKGLQAVGAAIKHKANEMTFPNFKLTDYNVADFEKVYRWTSVNGYFITSTDPLIISKIEGSKSWVPKSL